MKKTYEIPELSIQCFDIQEPITAEGNLSIGEDLEEW